eukprot:TRINITY_DN3704_c0_g1_i1.p1 TRINITY_DN3704_c0_g1~~TRINITY_DN3704_c0_g1_i1.p1  ORF type:complete len:265 (+),score=48.25 TRINITY_DN3704_c0_g1_i1:63-797(+)
MHPVMMPETPLARMMWRFVPEDASREFRRSTSVDDSRTVPSHDSLASAFASAGALASSHIGLVGVAAQPKPDSRGRDTPAGVPSATRRKTPCGLLRYESVDETGRVWGMPNAGGKGQCLDCPKPSVPPSMRCEACQLAQTKGYPMAGNDLSALQGAFTMALASLPAKRRLDAETRLALLYSHLQCGQIAQPIQEALLKIASNLSDGSRSEAAAQVRGLVAHHWQQHKDWLTGLKCLAAVSLLAN